MKFIMYLMLLFLIGNMNIVFAHSSDIYVSLELTSSRDSNGYLIFTGNTNLPESIDLMITLANSSDDNLGQTKVKVHRGKFISEPFSNRGIPWPDGKYFVEVSSAVPRLHSKAVQQVIGDKGQYLKGPNVEFSDFFNVNTILSKHTLIVGIPKEIESSPFQSLGACLPGKRADNYAEWAYLMNNAVRMMMYYAEERMPQSTFLTAKKSIYFQVAGEDKGKYHIHLLDETSYGTSLAVLRPNFDMCTSPTELDDTRENLFTVVLAKFNGTEY